MKSAYSEFVSLKEAIPRSEDWVKTWDNPCFNHVDLLHYIVADPADPKAKFTSMPYPLREALVDIIREHSTELINDALIRMKARRDMLKEDAMKEVQAELGLRG